MSNIDDDFILKILKKDKVMLKYFHRRYFIEILLQLLVKIILNRLKT